uniref:Fibronectin type-III domain-containing protein n=1 Tax=Oryzias melastigma TaxID=30732 RepID=A0A3B3DJK5_ORYME
MKGELELVNTVCRDIKNTPSKAFISVKEAKLLDGGQYTLLLKNPGGEKVVHVNVVVLDKPGESQGPIVVTGINNDQCCLAWKPPLKDGGSTVSHYVVERRETSRLVWTVVDPKVETTCLKVTKLLEGDDSPKNLEVSNIKKDSMVLNWETPPETGGSPISGYIIEKHDKEGVRWTRCNRQAVTGLTFKVTGLLESHIYEFRVAAENAVGVGEPSSPTVFHKAVDPIFRPGPPLNPKVSDTTKSSAILMWSKPVCDGGCEIQGYIVECCTTTASTGPLETTETDIGKTKFEVLNLKEHQAYRFRVCACKDDFGKYSITANNAVGTVTEDLTVII